MSARILDGKSIAAQLRAELKDRVDTLIAGGITPRLAAVLVGDDPASAVYVGSKEKTAGKMGIASDVIRLPVATSDQQMKDLIDELNRRDDLHGYIIQSPLPEGLNEDALVERIDPAKDIDGFHPHNMGALTLGFPRMKPCTPAGVVEILVRSEIPIAGTETVILGRGNIVGRPLSILLSLKTPHGNSTVTLCHSRTANLADHCRRADILVLAMGQPESITGDMIKPGATVIDVGINRVDDPSRPRGYRLAGDAHFESVSEVAGAITPVPGGVGPMTVAMLMANTVTAAEYAMAQC